MSVPLGFWTNYFERLGVRLPTLVVSENKRINAVADTWRPAPDLSRGRAPWRVGWFGNIRCVRSFHILNGLARRNPDLIDVELRGRPTGELQALIAENLPFANMRFSGPYAPSELAFIYEACDLAWAIEFRNKGRILIGCCQIVYMKVAFTIRPPIALAGTETARWLYDRAAGVILQNPDEALEAFITTLTSSRYAELKHAVAAIPTTDLVHTVEACQQFANLLAGIQGGARGEIDERT